MYRHLQGLLDYALTGSEKSLQATVNTDQGAPYLSRHLAEAKGGRKSPQDRAEDGLDRWVVPEQTRCVMAAVDVQGGVNSRFVVQVHAIGPHMEQWLVDRFEIKESKRREWALSSRPSTLRATQRTGTCSEQAAAGHVENANSGHRDKGQADHR